MNSSPIKAAPAIPLKIILFEATPVSNKNANPSRMAITDVEPILPDIFPITIPARLKPEALKELTALIPFSAAAETAKGVAIVTPSSACHPAEGSAIPKILFTIGVSFNDPTQTVSPEICAGYAKNKEWDT